MGEALCLKLAASTDLYTCSLIRQVFVESYFFPDLYGC